MGSMREDWCTPECPGHPFLEGSWHMVVDTESIFGDMTKVQDLTAF